MNKTVAISIWENRISPVFDSSTLLMILEIQESKIVQQRYLTLNSSTPLARAQELADENISKIICGAISLEFERALNSEGIEIESFVSGNADQVIHAFLDGALLSSQFYMPGCRKQHRNRHRHAQQKGG